MKFQICYIIYFLKGLVRWSARSCEQLKSLSFILEPALNLNLLRIQSRIKIESIIFDYKCCSDTNLLKFESTASPNSMCENQKGVHVNQKKG